MVSIGSFEGMLERQDRHTVSVISVQQPAQIVDYGTIGYTPIALAIALAIGALPALGFTLFASVRQRRFDLALLKALRLSPGQLRAAVAWRSSVAATPGVVVGLPLGIVLGWRLLDAFARSLNAVRDPVVPTIALLAVGLGALCSGNLAAAHPGARPPRLRPPLVAGGVRVERVTTRTAWSGRDGGSAPPDRCASRSR